MCITYIQTHIDIFGGFPKYGYPPVIIHFRLGFSMEIKAIRLHEGVNPPSYGKPLDCSPRTMAPTSPSCNLCHPLGLTIWGSETMGFQGGFTNKTRETSN